MQKIRVVLTLIIALHIFAPRSLAFQAPQPGGRLFRALIASTNTSRIAYGQSYDASSSQEVHSSQTPVLKEPTPTPTATPTPSPIPARQTAYVPASGGGNLDADALFNLANAHRAALGLPAFVKDDRLCALAAERSPEVMPEVSGGYMHKGLYDRNIGYWITENIVTMGSVEQAFDWWVHHGIHQAALEGDFTYSCVSCSGIACAQEFSNFQPK